jgi:hypothetical protein
LVAQVHFHCTRSGCEADLVAASAADEFIRPGATREGIVHRSSLQLVVAARAIEGVSAIASDQAIITATGLDRVGSRTSVERVPARAGGKSVGALA